MSVLKDLVVSVIVPNASSHFVHIPFRLYEYDSHCLISVCLSVCLYRWTLNNTYIESGNNWERAYTRSSVTLTTLFVRPGNVSFTLGGAERS